MKMDDSPEILSAAVGKCEGMLEGLPEQEGGTAKLDTQIATRSKQGDQKAEKQRLQA